MRVDNELDKTALVAFLRGRYGFEIERLRFVPKGELSYGYVAEDRSGPRYFVKLHLGDADSLDEALTLSVQLHDECGFTAVLPPIRTRDGALRSGFGGYPVIVYDFLERGSVEDRGATPSDYRRAGVLIGELHACTRRLDLRRIPVEDFSNRYDVTLREFFRRGIDPVTSMNPHQREVAEALAADRRNLERAYSRYEELRAYARSLDRPRVITHGDPNWANILEDADGRFRLIDWDGAVIGPPEQDLVFFTGEPFEEFLPVYLDTFDPGPLDVKVFLFYFYHWCFGEIGSYAARILDRDTVGAQAESDLDEFRAYVPFDQDVLEAGAEKVAYVLRGSR